MESRGLVALELTLPPDEWKPFMRRKIAQWMSVWTVKEGGNIIWSKCLDEVMMYIETLPEDKREQARKERIDMWRFIFMCDKKEGVITEGEAINGWIERMYNPKKRKVAAKVIKTLAEIFFDQMDANKDGIVTFTEYLNSCGAISEEAARYSFDAVDINKDGLLSREEWVTAVLEFLLCSGPDNPVSNIFGLVES